MTTTKPLRRLLQFTTAFVARVSTSYHAALTLLDPQAVCARWRALSFKSNSKIDWTSRSHVSFEGVATKIAVILTSQTDVQPHLLPEELRSRLVEIAQTAVKLRTTMVEDYVSYDCQVYLPRMLKTGQLEPMTGLQKFDGFGSATMGRPLAVARFGLLARRCVKSADGRYVDEPVEVIEPTGVFTEADLVS